jgi:hypothetical protein
VEWRTATTSTTSSVSGRKVVVEARVDVKRNSVRLIDTLLIGKEKFLALEILRKINKWAASLLACSTVQTWNAMLRKLCVSRQSSTQSWSLPLVSY